MNKSYIFLLFKAGIKFINKKSLVKKVLAITRISLLIELYLELLNRFFLVLIQKK